MSRSRTNAAHALDTLARIARLSDRKIGDMLDLSRQSAYAKRHGDSGLSLEDIDELSSGLDVPAIVFLMDHQELMRWIGDNNWRGPNGKRDVAVPVSNCKQVVQISLFDDEHSLIDESLLAA